MSNLPYRMINGQLRQENPLDEGVPLPTEWEDAADTITRLNEEVERLRAAQSWQPIETAPRDGTWIVGLVDGAYPAIMYWAPLSGYGERYPWIGRDHSAYREESVAHWMPLPPPPALTKEKIDASSQS